MITNIIRCITIAIKPTIIIIIIIIIIYEKISHIILELFDILDQGMEF